MQAGQEQLNLLSVVIPAKDEEGAIEQAVMTLDTALRESNVPHEIVVVDDGSSDRTWEILLDLKEKITALSPVQNKGEHGFGRAVIFGLHHALGDAVVITMADMSDDPQDIIKYWHELNKGVECVFGSRFIRGGGVYDYPKVKYLLNRLINWFIMLLFRISLNDTTNAFKAYRKEVIAGCQPLIAPHFNLTVELPLKAIIRGYSWTVVPITWKNRTTGEAKLKLKEMGSRYIFIILYLWLEKFFSRGDYRRRDY